MRLSLARLIFLYSFGVPVSSVAVVPSCVVVLTKSTGQVCVAVQIGGLQSSFSQFAGSWQGYLKCPSYPQLVNEPANIKAARAYLIFFILRPLGYVVGK